MADDLCRYVLLETGQRGNPEGLVEVARISRDSAAKRSRRLPHVVDLERDEPFRAEDRDQLLAQCARITNGQEFWFGQDRSWHYVVQFSEPHHAEALKHWLWQERFMSRPFVKFGPSREEHETFAREIVAWGLRTGALRRVLSAYRRAYQEGQSLTKCHSIAQQALGPYLPPNTTYFNPARVMTCWGEVHHGDWIEGRRMPATVPATAPEWCAPDDAYPHSED